MTGPPPLPVYLALDGVEVPIKYTGGQEQPPDRSGELVTTFANNTFTSEKASETKRSWRFTTRPLDGATEWVTWRSVLESGAFMQASGYAISRAMVPVDPLDPTGPQTAEVVPVFPQMLDVGHARDGDVDITYEISFLLLEV